MRREPPLIAPIAIPPKSGKYMIDSPHAREAVYLPCPAEIQRIAAEIRRENEELDSFRPTKHDPGADLTRGYGIRTVRVGNQAPRIEDGFELIDNEYWNQGEEQC